MTRINCVPPSELHKKHLMAEYYELPRVFGNVRQLIEKGKDPAAVEAPEEYTLGVGHMKFFYMRLGYCLDRQAELILEMMARGMKPSMTDLKGLAKGIPDYCFGVWQPDEKALALNRARIAERLETMAAKPKRPVPKITD